MKILAHILIMLAFAGSIYVAGCIVRDTQREHRNPHWEKCRMCNGRGIIPPLPEEDRIN